MPISCLPGSAMPTDSVSAAEFAHHAPRRVHAGALEHVEAVRSAAPHVAWAMEAYHEERGAESGDSPVRKVTHRGAGGYTAPHWDDVSSPFPGKQPTPTPAGRSHAQNRVGPLGSSTLHC